MSTSDTAISVERLSKSYLIGHERKARGYQTLRECLIRGVKGFGRAAVDTLRGRQILEGEEIEEFWALKDISFEVERGEVLGIIGRNGAGKSTLLKILSRITEPTDGCVRIRGRVASLLEVGTGFHPELTGRENIFLNGAVLGMTRSEIKRKFDEIVAFAEVEQFLDTPVKRYSSGMYVRLAFAIAAHLEPEILVVDEVLAVGDSEFQKKCLGKMDEVASGGRTVLFVSHNAAAIDLLCPRCIALDRGGLAFDGKTPQALLSYYSRDSERSNDLRSRTDRRGTGEAKCVSVIVRDNEGNAHAPIQSGRPFEVLMEIESNTILESVLPGINVMNSLGQRIATFWNGFSGNPIMLHPGTNHLLLSVKRLDLAPGNYCLTTTLGQEEAIDVVEGAIDLIVSAPGNWSPARFPALGHGPLFVEFAWTKYD